VRLKSAAEVAHEGVLVHGRNVLEDIERVDRVKLAALALFGEVVPDDILGLRGQVAAHHVADLLAHYLGQDPVARADLQDGVRAGEHLGDELVPRGADPDHARVLAPEQLQIAAELGARVHAGTALR
jgi:hypothetical protein